MVKSHFSKHSQVLVHAHSTGLQVRVSDHLLADILQVGMPSTGYPGLTYPTFLKPVTTLQKRVVKTVMTFSDPRSHSEPLLKSLRLLKFSDIQCRLY